LFLIMYSTSRKLPEGPIIVGYGQWGQCDNDMVQAAQNAVNVIIWAFINMVKNPSGQPTIQHGLNFQCIAQIVKRLRDMNLDTVHLISIGGWDSPHIDTSFSAEDWLKVWINWNNNTVAKPDLGFFGFDGIDWDLEGNDDLQSQWNVFTVPTLNLMGSLSQLAKKNGYIVSMAPAQSYLDVGTNVFDRSLLHSPTWKSNFPYHGDNTYAPIIAKYGQTIINSTISVPTFDFISLQLYEGWSRANSIINDNHIPVATYLIELVNSMSNGWDVDFSSDPDIGIKTQKITVPQSQLVIGLANGWAAPRPNKVLLIWPNEAKDAYVALKAQGKEPKGFMFWDIKDEGDMVNGTQFYLAKSLNTFLNIRPSNVGEKVIINQP